MIVCVVERENFFFIVTTLHKSKKEPTSSADRWFLFYILFVIIPRYGVPVKDFLQKVFIVIMFPEFHPNTKNLFDMVTNLLRSALGKNVSTIQ